MLPACFLISPIADLAKDLALFISLSVIPLDLFSIITLSKFTLSVINYDSINPDSTI